MRFFTFFLLLPLFQPIVSATGVDTILDSTQELVSKYSQVKVKKIGGSVLLAGKVSTLEQLWELKAISDSLKQSGVAIANAVRMTEEGYEKLVVAISEKIASPHIQVKRVGESIFIEGTASSDLEADRNMNIATMMLNIPVKPGVRLPANEKEPLMLMSLVDMQKIRKGK